MYYVGVDLHKEQSWFYILDESGNKISSKSITNDPEVLHKYFKQIPKPFILAVEATYNWYYFVDIAELYAEKVYLANSYELKAFAKRHKKTDKIDSRLIADLLRKDSLPFVYIADKRTREIRELLRYRMNITKDRSRNIFRVKNLLDKIGLDSTGDFTTQVRRKEVLLIETDPLYKKVIEGYTGKIDFLSKKYWEITKDIMLVGKSDKDIELLVAIPGLDYFSASLIKSEIVTIKRFKSFSRLCAYAGLNPNVHQSANKLKHGNLSVIRRKNLQWILLEVVMHFINSSPVYTNKYERLKKKKGHNTAKVVMARDFLKVIYHVLKEEREYYKPENKSQSVAASALCGV